MGTLLQDLRYGLRMLAKNPGFTAVAVLTLALGIGANTAIFSLIDAVLLKMLPVKNAQQLVLLNWASHGWPKGIVSSLSGNSDRDKTGRMTSTSFSYPAYEQIQTRNQVFSGVLAMAGNGSALNVGYNGEAGRGEGELISGTFFHMLGVQPILGRSLAPDDDRIGASPAAVISYGYWERRFGRDPAVVGRTITLNGVPFTVVGVSPPEFYGVQPGRAVEVWLPLHTQAQVEPREAGSGPQPAATLLFEARDNWWVLIMGRMKPGMSEQQVRAELDVILHQSMAPDVTPATKPETIPHLGAQSGSQGLDSLRRQFSRPLFVLMTVVGLVLLIACANVANLLLARAASRQKEMAVRLAIGASRHRLIRQLMTESVLLAALGGVLGLVLAFWGADLLVALMSSGRNPLTLDVTPDPRVLSFTAAVSVLTGILFGISPALRSTRVDLTPALKESSGTLLAATHRKRGLRLGLGKTLVVTQVSLSLLLLVGAGLFVRTLSNLENVHLGFEQRNLLLFGINPTQGGYKRQRLADFYRELTRRLEALPGVRSVSMSRQRLIAGGSMILSVRISGYIPKPGQNSVANINDVGPKFFETMGIPLLLGRTIGEGDTEAAPKVAVVNEKFVREFLGNENPIGRRFGFGDKKTSGDIEIIGVVGDAKYDSLRKEVPPTVYVPCLQDLTRLGAMQFEVRTVGDPMGMIPAVRHVAQDMDRNLPLYQVKSEVEQIDGSLFQERLFARLTSFFGLLALLLACVGIYGLMSFGVTQRTSEIGIRMALGAQRSDVLRMVMRETVVLATLGVSIGIPAALAATRLTSSLISGLLFGLKATDPVSLTIAAIVMASVALLAGYIPARRATKVDPMVALRYE